jgi:hypothetical protein
MNLEISQSINRQRTFTKKRAHELRPEMRDPHAHDDNSMRGNGHERAWKKLSFGVNLLDGLRSHPIL